MLKVIDARMSEVRKVLKDAGINVVSITEVHKEETVEQEAEKAADQENG